MPRAFEKWVKKDLNKSTARGFQWSASECKAVFGEFDNDAVRSSALETFTRKFFTLKGKIAVEDVAAIISLTTNSSVQKSMVEACAPCMGYVKQGTSTKPIEDAISNTAVASGIKDCKWGENLFMWSDGEDSDSDSDNGSGDGADYNGPPPPGFSPSGGGGDGPPPGNVFGGMMGMMGMMGGADGAGAADMQALSGMMGGMMSMAANTANSTGLGGFGADDDDNDDNDDGDDFGGDSGDDFGGDSGDDGSF